MAGKEIGVDEARLLASIVASSRDAILTLDRDHLITSWNKGAEQMLGYTADEVIGKPLSILIDPDDLAGYRSAVTQFNQDFEIIDHVTRRVRKDGVPVDVSLTVSPIYDHEGTLIGASGIARDIRSTIRARAERERLASIVDTSEDAIYSVSLDGQVMTWNRGATRIYGYAPEEIIGHPVSLLFPEDRRHEEADFLDLMRRGERIEHFLTQRVRKDGTILHAGITVSPIHDQNGVLVGSSRVLRDLTDRMKAYLDRLFLAAIVDTSDDAIIGKKIDGTITSWNKGAERLFGYAAEEAIGQPINIVIPPERMFEEMGIQEQLRKRQKIDHLETVRINKLGDSIDVSVTVSPIFDAQGQVIGASKIVRDITNQKNAEAAMRDNENALRVLSQSLDQKVRERTAELEAAYRELESITHMMSHDLKAPLRSITFNCRLLEEEYSANLPSEAFDLLSRQRKSCIYLGQLMDDLMSLTRLSRAEVSRKQIDLSVMATDIAAEVERRLGSQNFEFSVQPGMKVAADSTLTRLALTNLIENAAKFRQVGSRVAIEVGMDDAGFFVRDQGIGFDPAYAEKIFEPFQRLHTTSEYSGTGIGLANVRRITERHGGRVWVDTKPGEGSVFHFTLEPADEEERTFG